MRPLKRFRGSDLDLAIVTEKTISGRERLKIEAELPPQWMTPKREVFYERN